MAFFIFLAPATSIACTVALGYFNLRLNQSTNARIKVIENNNQAQNAFVAKFVGNLTPTIDQFCTRNDLSPPKPMYTAADIINQVKL